MAYTVYSEEKLTEVCRLLLEMRDNCVPKDVQTYDDPKRKAKFEALSVALDAVDVMWNTCGTLESAMSKEERTIQKEKDFEEMANACEKYMQKWTHPHNTIIVTQCGIEVVEGIKAKPFEVVD